MGCPPIARGNAGDAGANVICSNMAWRIVMLSFLILLGESLANQSKHFNTDPSYDHCEGNTSLIANGVCDISVNIADCGFDGGDCCECTCALQNGVPCDRTEAGFSCQDPYAPVDCGSTMETQTKPLTVTPLYHNCVGEIPHIRDGSCNEANNNVNCDFDGGDCCPSTCAGGLAHSCGGYRGAEFDCRNPDVYTPRRRLSSSDSSCGGTVEDIGNTRCDGSLNNFECGYDGGDCCHCTCTQDLTDWKFSDDITNYCLDGEFDCLDPSADCNDLPTPSPTPSPVYTGVCKGDESFLGDGLCDYITNNLACDWDGGDCCECTCDESARFGCLDFACLDPNVPTGCESNSSVPSPTDSSVPSSAVSPGPDPAERPVPSSTVSPLARPTVSPVRSPTRTPLQSPTESPVPSPTRTPVQTPTVSPVPSPTLSPVQSPTGTPLQNPTEIPVASPTETPMHGPTVSPVPSPTESTVPSLTASPVQGPTESPVPSPTVSPVASTTESPVPSTTESPLPSTTESPVPSAAVSPVTSTTVSPVPSTADTSLESDSPVQSNSSSAENDSFTESDSSTGSRGVEEGEGASASSATLGATTGMAIVIWEVVGTLFVPGLEYRFIGG